MGIALAAILVLLIVVIAAVYRARLHDGGCPAGQSCLPPAPPSCPAGQSCQASAPPSCPVGLSCQPPVASVLRLDGGWDLPGNDMTGMPIAAPTEHECANACASSPSCAAYTYDTTGTQRCWVKTGVAVPKGNAGLHSGVVVGRNTASLAGSCRRFAAFPGYDLPGSDRQGMPVPAATADACAALCAGDQGCVAYAWASGSPGNCWLKWDVPGPLPRPGLASGVCLGR